MIDYFNKKINVNFHWIETESCFVTGDLINGPEKYMGKASTQEECLTLVKDLEPSATGATFQNRDGPGGCWAEFGKTFNPNPVYKTCPFSEGKRYDNWFLQTMYDLNSKYKMLC